MATYSKNTLSESSIGNSIFLTGTGSAALIHSSPANATDIDEVWLYANNVGTSDATLSIYWGTTGVNITGTTNILGPVTVQAYAGPILISAGFVLKGSGSTASNIYGLPSIVSGVNVFGYVNRITA